MYLAFPGEYLVKQGQAWPIQYVNWAYRHGVKSGVCVMDNVDVSGVVDNQIEKTVSVDDSLPKTQNELNELVGREKLKERDKIRRELDAKHQAEIQKLQSDRTVARQSETDQNSGAKSDSDDVSKIATAEVQKILQQEREKAQKEAREAEMQNVADTFVSKLKSGSNKYEDFDEVVADLDLSEFPQLVHAIHGFDNVAGIMYELANDPRKLEKINAWLRNMPERGLKELKKLSDSIRDTDAAFNEFEPTDAPLSETKPSNVSASSGLSKLEMAKQKYRF